MTIVKKSAERFNFAAVAPGTYKIMAAASDTHKVSYVGAREVELLEGDNYQMQVSTDFTGVLIDDFDRELNLMNYLNSGNWYITKDGNEIFTSLPGSVTVGHTGDVVSVSTL